MQVVEHAKFEEMAENNHQRTLALRAPRGIVFDRDLKVLVENRRSYSISIVREHTKDLNRTVRLLADAIGIDEASVRLAVDRHRREPSYRPIMVVQDATLAQVAAVKARRLDFELPDIVVEQGADAPVSRSDGGASVRLRRRGERRAGHRRRWPQERRHRRPGRDREDLQQPVDGRRRRQAAWSSTAWGAKFACSTKTRRPKASACS